MPAPQKGKQPAPAARATTAAPARPGPQTPAPAAATSHVPAVREEKKHLPSTAPNYAEYAGAGLENAGREDFAIPFLTILQKLSPQLDRTSPAYIETAEDGMFFDSATAETFDGNEGILFIPCFYKRSFVAWTIREKGGGYKGEYAVGDPIIGTTQKDSRGREILPGDGTVQLVDTRLFGGLRIGEGGAVYPGLITMSSTQIKKAKRWNTLMQSNQVEEQRVHGSQLPIFAHAYRLTTTSESNDQGNWMGWVVGHEGMLHEVLPQDAAAQAFHAAKSFYDQLRSGTLKMQAQPQEELREDDVEHPTM